MFADLKYAWLDSQTSFEWSWTQPYIAFTDKYWKQRLKAINYSVHLDSLFLGKVRPLFHILREYTISHI